MRVVIAPDCFGGTLTAAQAADAIATGWRRGAPDHELILRPLADGGPGFVDVLHTAIGGVLHRTTVTGPLGTRSEVADARGRRLHRVRGGRGPAPGPARTARCASGPPREGSVS